MWTVIVGMFRFVWVWVLPWVGPLLPWLLRHLPGVERVKSAGRILVIVCGIASALIVAYAAFAAMRDPVKDYVAASEVNAALLAGQNAALKRANAQKDATLAEREADYAALEAEINRLRKEMEAARANSPDPDRVVYPADDPWLLEKRSRLP